MGDVVLFSAHGEFFAAGTIAATFHNPALAQTLWGVDEKGQTWEYMYALDEIHPISIPYPEFSSVVGYKPNWVPQGFNVLDESKSSAAMAHFDLFSDKHPPEMTKADFEQAVKNFDGEVDAKAETQRRKESGFIRDRLFPTAIATCDICGAQFPREFLVAAHIKKRARCTYEEKTDIPAIVMAACTFGCDALYEKGYITVDEHWTIRSSTQLPPGTAAHQRSEALVGRTFGSPDPARGDYFTWPRIHVFKP